ncbi:MAG: DMT family transporter [Pseudomonadota bacterium]
MAHSHVAPMEDARGLWFAAAGVLFASMCFGLVPFFARSLTEAGLAPHAVAFWRYVMTGLVLAAFLRAPWGAVAWGLGAGVALGVGWVGYVRALEVVPVSTVGVLYMTYPVFTVIFAWALFSDRPSVRAVVAAGLIVAGAVLAGSPAAVPVEMLPLLLVALGAPLGFGFGISVLVHRLTPLPPMARMAAVSLGAMIGLGPLMLATPGAEVFPQDGRGWALVFGIALGTALIPQLIYTICAPRVGASRAAVLGSIELPTMIALGIVMFGERLTFAQAAGAALVLAAILLTGSRKVRGVATTASTRR